MSYKAADQALEVLTLSFPDLRAGRWNCRPISGSSTWSQHAWGAALDIHHVDYGYSASAVHQAWLDKVNGFLVANLDRLSIRTRLWRVKDHYDHIHIDFWPRGYGRPPCDGGSHRTQYSTSLVVNGDPGPENGPWTGDPTDPPTDPPDRPPTEGYLVEVHRSNIRKGDRGDLVAICQSLLARHGFPPDNTFNANHEPDGIGGPGFDDAVRAFQASAGLSVDGIVGPKSWAGVEAV